MKNKTLILICSLIISSTTFSSENLMSKTTQLIVEIAHQDPVFKYALLYASMELSSFKDKESIALHEELLEEDTPTTLVTFQHILEELFKELSEFPDKEDKVEKTILDAVNYFKNLKYAPIIHLDSVTNVSLSGKDSPFIPIEKYERKA